MKRSPWLRASSMNGAFVVVNPTLAIQRLPRRNASAIVYYIKPMGQAWERGRLVRSEGKLSKAPCIAAGNSIDIAVTARKTTTQR